MKVSMVYWVGMRQLFVLSLLIASVSAFAQGTLERDRPVLEDDEISFTYEYVWGGSDGFGNYMPIRLVIDNPLDNDRGVVTVTNGTYRVQHPIEMPSRSLRSFIVYVPVSYSYGETTISLNCDQADLKADLEIFSSMDESNSNVALVSDSTALITFLRSQREILDQGTADTYDDRTITYRDFATLPENAPDRAIGYDGMKMVILGEGAERLNDVQVAAIQRYLLMGGTVLFTGGSVSPVLRDKRWEAFLPGTDPVVVNLEGSQVISVAGDSPFLNTFSVSKITPSAGSSGLEEEGVPIFWYRKCGLGMSVFWAFDPFVAPMRTYAGRSKIFSDTLKSRTNEGAQYLSEVGAMSSYGYDDYMYGSYSSYGYGYDDPSAGVFTVSMPPTSKIFTILAAFFICVVPLNFLLLGKLKRGELAWFTSPIICLVFAGVFFMSARDLYGAELSRSTSSVLIVHQGSPIAYAIGNQQLFFPAGGRYDLELTGIESLTTSSDYSGNYYGDSRDSGFSGDLIDVGEVIAPEAGVSNLSFREVHYRQQMSWPYKMPFAIEVTDESGRKRVKGRLMNDSQYSLLDVKIWIGRTPISIGDIQPGESVGIDEFVVLRERLERLRSEPPVSLNQYALTADIAGLETGIQIGIEESVGTRLFMTLVNEGDS